jgi:hypothetical protein
MIPLKKSQTIVCGDTGTKTAERQIPRNGIF